MINEENKVSEINVSYRPAISKNPVIGCANDAYVLFKKFFDDNTICLQESFMVMYLNRAKRVIGIYPMSTGGITETIVDLRLILSVALKTCSTYIMLAHNHPSSNLTPSAADISVTLKIKEAAAIMDIRLLDHLILVEGAMFYSFANEGLI